MEKLKIHILYKKYTAAFEQMHKPHIPFLKEGIRCFHYFFFFFFLLFLSN